MANALKAVRFLLAVVVALLGGAFAFLKTFHLWKPIVWASLGIAICCGCSVIGAALGMYVAGSSLMGAAIKRPEMKTKHLITILFCEAVAIYGVVFSIILSVALANLKGAEQESSLLAQAAGYRLFWAGCTVGLVNVAGGLCVGSIGSVAAVVDAQRPSMFVRLVVLEVLASAVSLFGVIGGFVQVNSAVIPT